MKQKKFDWGYFLKHIAIIAIPVALQNLLTTTGSMLTPLCWLLSEKKRSVLSDYVLNFPV